MTMNESSLSDSLALHTNFPIRNGTLTRRFVKKELVLVCLFILLAVFSGIVIGCLKINSLLNWCYTSDLFTYDTVIQETARGFRGVEFTFGNTLGDHAYLFLLFLAPLKFLLKSRIIYILVLLGPISYSISCIIVFITTRQFLNIWKTFLLSAIYLLGFSQMYQGLYENVYGMHPDTFSGFIAVAVTAFLIWREKNISQNKNSNFQTIGAVFFLFVFLILKEEMALLAIIFCVFVFLFRKTAFQRNLIFLSVFIFGVDLIILMLSKTPFNRTNSLLLMGLYHSIKTHGLGFLFIDPNRNSHQLQTFWFAILISSLLFLAGMWFSKHKNPYVTGLFVIGLVKLFFSFSVSDFDLSTWHNFPGLIMITTAVLLQFLFMDKIKNFYSVTALLMLMIISIFCFQKYEVPFIKYQFQANAERKGRIDIYSPELSKIMKQIDPMQVVAIPAYTARKWGGYRYAFYPRGVTMSPLGIADMVVYPIQEAADLAGGFDKTVPLEKLSASFHVVLRTPHFILLKRNSLSKIEISSREAFYQLLK